MNRRRCAFWLLTAVFVVSTGSGCASNRKIAAKLQAERAETLGRRTHRTPDAVPVPVAEPVPAGTDRNETQPVPELQAPAAELDNKPTALLTLPEPAPMNASVATGQSSPPAEPRHLNATPGAIFASGQPDATPARPLSAHDRIMLPPPVSTQETLSGLAPAPAVDLSDDVVTAPAPRFLFPQPSAPPVKQVAHSSAATANDPLPTRLDTEFEKLRTERNTRRSADSDTGAKPLAASDRFHAPATSQRDTPAPVTNEELLRDLNSLVADLANGKSDPVSTSASRSAIEIDGGGTDLAQPESPPGERQITTPSDLIAVGRELLEQKRYSDAEAAFREATRLARTSDELATATYLLATSLRKQQRRDEAANYYQQVASSNENPQLTRLARWQIKNLSTPRARL